MIKLIRTDTTLDLSQKAEKSDDIVIGVSIIINKLNIFKVCLYLATPALFNLMIHYVMHCIIVVLLKKLLS